MPTVDLAPDSADPNAQSDGLEGLPRRVALTLTELRFLAEQAGGAPLPFEAVAEDDKPTGSSLEDRLGQSPSATEDALYADTIASLNDPQESLARRGLLVDGVADAGICGALGLIAKPVLAVDIDVAAGPVRARSWHRHSGHACATLATTDGVVFELAWFEANQWAAELASVATYPEDLDFEQAGQGDIPTLIDVPFELLDAAGEAHRTQQGHVVPVLAAQHSGAVLGADGKPLDDATVVAALNGLGLEARGRLRALAADVTRDGAPVVGLVSWTLLTDGWRSLRAYTSDGVRRVELKRVEPTELASLLAPVLAEVSR